MWHSDLYQWSFVPIASLGLRPYSHDGYAMHLGWWCIKHNDIAAIVWIWSLISAVISPIPSVLQLCIMATTFSPSNLPFLHSLDACGVIALQNLAISAAICYMPWSFIAVWSVCERKERGLGYRFKSSLYSGPVYTMVHFCTVWYNTTSTHHYIQALFTPCDTFVLFVIVRLKLIIIFQQCSNCYTFELFVIVRLQVIIIFGSCSHSYTFVLIVMIPLHLTIICYDTTSTYHNTEAPFTL